MDSKFTIITPCYNSERTIRKTIESVLAQTYVNYEYIIIDGKSNDSTLDIINEYKEAFQGRLQVISEKDHGIYDAMNKGIRLAKGDIIGIINSDDWYEPDTLENVLENETKTAYAIYYGILRFIKDGRECWCAIYNHEFLNETMINHPTVFVTKEVYDKFGLFDCGYRAAADYEYMLRLYLGKEVIFVPIYRILANFRLGGVTGSYISIKETLQIKKKYGELTRRQYVISLFGIWCRKVLRI